MSQASQLSFISSSTGQIVIANTSASTSTTTGALIVTGGVGVGGNLKATEVYDNNKRVTNKATSVAYSMIFGGQ